MMLERCPRCGRPIPGWQPVHLSCLAYRIRGLLIAVSVLGLIAGALVFIRVMDMSGASWFNAASETSGTISENRADSENPPSTGLQERHTPAPSTATRIQEIVAVAKDATPARPTNIPATPTGPAKSTTDGAATKSAAMTETAIADEVLQSVIQTVASIGTADARATATASRKADSSATKGADSAAPSPSKAPAPVSCPGALPTRLVIGDTAQVINYQLNVRSGPGTRYSIARRLDVGRTMEVLDGPVCDDGQLWYYIRSEVIRPRDGSQAYQAEGWLVEESDGQYYLEPAN